MIRFVEMIRGEIGTGRILLRCTTRICPKIKEDILFIVKTTGTRLFLLLTSLMHAMIRQEGNMAMVNQMTKSWRELMQSTS
uniref:Uncharacterized protein n=1 Tax=Arundo donax TaxID=35708 RepID=A0A0A9GM80_ARUDO